MTYDKAKMSASAVLAGLLVIAGVAMADDARPDPVRICLDAMANECKAMYSPIDDKDGFVQCLDDMRRVCDTAYFEQDDDAPLGAQYRGLPQ